MSSDSGEIQAHQASNKWVHLGVGAGLGIFGRIGFLNNQHKNRAYEFYFTGGDYVDNRTLNAFSACYGFCGRSGPFVFAANTGFSLIKGERHPDAIIWEVGKETVCVGRTGEFFVVGLPVSVHLIGRLSRYFGLGLSCLGNLNTEKSFHGVLLSLHAGKIF